MRKLKTNPFGLEGLEGVAFDVFDFVINDFTSAEELPKITILALSAELGDSHPSRGGKGAGIV